MAAQYPTLAALLLLGVAACSPYAYTDATGSIDEAFKAVKSGFQTGEERRATDTRERDRIIWLQRRPRLVLEGCTQTTECKIVAEGPSGLARRAAAGAQPSLPATPAVTPALPDACAVVRDTAGRAHVPSPVANSELTELQRQQVISALAAYSAGLSAITRAKDREEFNAASAKLTTSLGALTGVVAGLTGIAAAPAALIGPAVVAGGNVAAWVVGAELDRRRYQTLRNSIVLACEPVRMLSRVVGVMFEEQRGNRLDMLNATLALDLARVNGQRSARITTDAVYGDLIDGLLERTATFNAVRSIGPQALGKAMADAHDKLVLAVWNNDGQFEAMSKSIEDLGSEIDKLRKAIDKFDTASAAARRR